MELGYLTSGNQLVVVDTIGWRTLFPGLRLLPTSGTFSHLNHSTTLKRRAEVTIRVQLHRRGWGGRGETILSRTPATWYQGDDFDIFLGPRATSIHVPWRGEFAKVHRPFFALEEPVKGLLESARAHGSAPCVVHLEHATVHEWRRRGSSVEVFAVERKEFSGFILGNLSALIEFSSVADAQGFSDTLPESGRTGEAAEKTTPDISRSKRVVWTPKVFALVMAATVIIGLVAIGSILGAVQGEYLKAAQAALGSVSGIALLSWVLPALLRTRRREFVDLVDKWPRTLCQRWGADHRTQSARASHSLQSMGITVHPGTSSLTPVDALLRSFPPEWFYGTWALQVGLLAIDRVLHLTGREVEFWWEYLPDRRECAFRAEDAGLRLYPLTAVMAVWQMRDPEGLESFARAYARELQLRLAFSESLPAFVALGFTAPGWDAFSKFWPRVDGQLAARSGSRLHPAQGEAAREHILEYGPVNLVIVEEAFGAAEVRRLVPTFAFPLAAHAATIIAQIEPPANPLERVTGIRAGPGSQPLTALMAPSASLGDHATGSRTVEISGVVESAELLADGDISAGPFHGSAVPPEGQGGRPVALTRLVARVVDVAAASNMFNGSPIWRLTLDLGFELPVLARGDLWHVPPKTGQVFTGMVWVFARLLP